MQSVRTSVTYLKVTFKNNSDKRKKKDACVKKGEKWEYDN